MLQLQQAPITINNYPELMRIFSDLKNQKNIDKVASELRMVYAKYINCSEDIFSKLQRFINNSDIQEKYSGLVALDQLTLAIQENQYMSFVNKFQSVVFQQFSLNTEERVLRKTAEVYGKLLRVGGTKIAMILEQNALDATKWLKSEASKENKKFAAILALKELLIEAPQITFNIIIESHLLIVLTLIKNKNFMLREESLEFFDVCVKQISQREESYQIDKLKLCSQEIARLMQHKEDEVTHGIVMAIKILLTYSKKDIFNNNNNKTNFDQMSMYVISKKDSKNPLIKKAVIETIPILAKYNPAMFEKTLLKGCIDYLLSLRKSSTGMREKSLCYNTIAAVFTNLSKNPAAIKKLAQEVVHCILAEETQLSQTSSTSSSQLLMQSAQQYRMTQQQQQLQQSQIGNVLNRNLGGSGSSFTGSSANLSGLLTNQQTSSPITTSSSGSGGSSLSGGGSSLLSNSFVPEIINCMNSILKIFNEEITEFCPPQLLINYILINGLHYESVEFLKSLSKLKEQKDLSKDQKQQPQLPKEENKLKNLNMFIQFKLLLCISFILKGTFFTFKQPPEMQKEDSQTIIMEFQTLFKNKTALRPDFRSDESIAMAIQTISIFNFDKYHDDLAHFVMYHVLEYLSNPKPEIRKAAAQTGSLLYMKHDKGQSISRNLMYEILDKFMNVAISDPEIEIRQTMLRSLNESFDSFLNSPNYLRKLFLCVNDRNTAVQELALIILCRLARYNPADIIPFMKKTLFQYLSSLAFEEWTIEQLVIDRINLLTCLMKHGRDIVRFHCDAVAQIIVKHLRPDGSQRSDETVTSMKLMANPASSFHYHQMISLSSCSAPLLAALFRLLGQLSAIGDPQQLREIKLIMPVILQAMQDKSYTIKRESAVRAFIEIMKNTGYVVLPYYRYPSIMEIVLSLIKNEVNPEIRFEVLRMIGCLGAIDHFYYKRMQKKFSLCSKSLFDEEFSDDVAAAIDGGHEILIMKAKEQSLQLQVKQALSIIDQQQSQPLKNMIKCQGSMDRLDEMILDTLKRRFRSTEKQRGTHRIQLNNLIAELHKYYENLILLGNFNQNKNMFLYLAQIEQQQLIQNPGIFFNEEGSDNQEGRGKSSILLSPSTANVGGKSERRDSVYNSSVQPQPQAQVQIQRKLSSNKGQQSQFYFFANSMQDVNVEELLQATTVIQLNSPDYYSRVVLKTLLKILCDPSLRPHHDLAIDTIQCILGTLKSRTTGFLNILIPVFLKVAKQDDLREKLLVLIEKVIKHCGCFFEADYIDAILCIFMEYALEPKSMLICFDILLTLVLNCKTHLQHKIEPLIRVINQLISNNKDNKDLIKKGLCIYYALSELLDSHLHMIIPFLCELIVEENSLSTSGGFVDQEIHKEIINLFICIATTCNSTIQSLQLIVQALLQSLVAITQGCGGVSQGGGNSSSSSGSGSSSGFAYSAMQNSYLYIMDCFVVFILKYKNAFLVYLPLINKYVTSLKIMHNLYKDCLNILLNYGNLEEIQNLLSGQDESSFGLQQQQQNPITNNFGNNTIILLIEQHRNAQLVGFQSHVPPQEPKDPALYKRIDASQLIQEFDTSQRRVKEDWIEWMRKSSVELLRQSPNLVLSPCHSIAEVYPELATELYNIAFACIWGVLNDKQKENIISQLHRVISPKTNENIPINILQTILNLAEFMQHDKEGLQIDNSSLGDLAERCMAYAKELQYREHDFETANEKSIERLISLYTNIDQKEAAAGLLHYAKTNLNIDVSKNWYERLQRWEKALDEYRIKQLQNQNEDYFEPRMRCYNALSDWEGLISNCDEFCNSQYPKGKNVVNLAANAAMNLGRWDKLRSYAELVSEENEDKNFWMAAVHIQQNNFEEAHTYITSAVRNLDSKVSGLLQESYGRAFDSLLRLQQLFEMEEIIEFKEFRNKVYKAREGRNDQHNNLRELLVELERRKSLLMDTWSDRLTGNPKDIDTWQKVLSVRGLLFSKCEDMETWMKFSRLALKQQQMQISQRVINDLKFQFEEEYRARLQIGQTQQQQQSTKISKILESPSLNSLQRQDSDLFSSIQLNTQQPVTRQVVEGTVVGGLMHPKITLADLECLYLEGFLKEKEVCDKIQDLLLKDDMNDLRLPEERVDNHLRGKMFLKMGNWMREKTEELYPSSLDVINKLYTDSLSFDPLNHKTWHAYAMLNYDMVKFYSKEAHRKHSTSVQSPEVSQIKENILQAAEDQPREMFANAAEQKKVHVVAALKGFVQSIALGCRAEHRSKFVLQDSLRLLNIVFEHTNSGGEETATQVVREFTDSYALIDISAWIEVVPQIIARINTPSQCVQDMLHALLVFISKHHPQSIIYPLTVAAKSKNSARQRAARRVLDDIRTHAPALVRQAFLISDELNRTAILLKELWHEGIEEAWKSYNVDKNNSFVIRTLQQLHDVTKLPPESLSEIAFHQQFGADISEAAAWLQRFVQTDDYICLCQAFDIYYSVYMQISAKLESLKFVYLENVSPKLLSTKNCELAIPGSYKPHKPVIRISCFCPKLQVLQSKQRPRKLIIYGSDSKEHHFLLKGREDLRQDERVMQLFALVNRLLHNNPETEKKDLQITRFSVVPLETKTGLLSWVQNCDTLQILIREYREQYNIRTQTEATLKQAFSVNYDQLPLPNKVEIFRHVLENTKGEDLQKVLWLKSPNSETWLERRTAYTRSLATMSIVGYILGLGDRHPSNIMLQRFTGKIVHIDFGDCFEVAMKREKFPERVPFRLTRMLTNAMEACGIEGNYRNICELVMRVLRDNRESLLAVLEAFVHDPLLNWRLLTLSTENQIGGVGPGGQGPGGPGGAPNANNTSSPVNKNKQQQQQITQVPDQLQPVATAQQQQHYVGSLIMQGASMAMNKMERKKTKHITEQHPMADKVPSPKRKQSGRERELQAVFADEEREKPTEILNKKALEVMDRIKKKLIGRDFKESEVLNVETQVKKLITQATSHENICQAYIGWCPFW